MQNESIRVKNRGAIEILAERIAENAEANDYIKSIFWKQGEAISNIKQYYLLEGDGNHGHTGIYGPVRRLMSE